MRIDKPPEFFTTIKDKYLLLDTNVFIDASLNPKEFGTFFNELKDNNAVPVTITAVLVEFLKGAAEKERLKIKKEAEALLCTMKRIYC